MDMTWTEQANCNGIDTEEFFPQDESAQYANETLLRRVCSNCVVQEACLNYALHNNVLGWWGNTSDNKRKKLRKELGIIAVPVVPDRE